MLKPAKPANEADRLRALYHLNLLDTEPEERFDRLARMAKRMFQVPIALVSLVDSDRQWFKSKFGLEASETSRDISFCGHAILGTETLVVENALADDRFRDNPLVIEEPKIRFYAGTPIKTPDGFAIGTLCIIDKVARLFRDEDVAMLEDMARMVESEIAALQLATMDELTGVSNRRGFYLIAEHSLTLCVRNKSPATLAVIDLDGFKSINDTYGHGEGDDVLKTIAGFLKTFFRDSDLVGRFGGDEFAVMMLGSDEEEANCAISRGLEELKSYNANNDKPYDIDVSVGLATFSYNEPKTIHQLVELADAEMYKQKRSKKSD